MPLIVTHDNGKCEFKHAHFSTCTCNTICSTVDLSNPANMRDWRKSLNWTAGTCFFFSVHVFHEIENWWLFPAIFGLRKRNALIFCRNCYVDISFHFQANHLPGIHALTYRPNIAALQTKLDFIPKTYVLPQDMDKLQNEVRRLL